MSTSTSAETGSRSEPKEKTDLRTQVSPSLQKIVNDYVITEQQSQSRLWPLVEEALKMLETGFDRKEVIRQFRSAFAKANHIREGELTSNADYTNYSMIAGRIVNVASMGRKWVTGRRARKCGFWRMYDESKEEPKTAITKKKKAVDDDMSQASLRRQAKEGVGNAEVYAEHTVTSPHMKADKPWRTRCRIIIKNEPDAFIEMVEGLVDEGLLPDGILAPLTLYLRGE